MKIAPRRLEPQGAISTPDNDYTNAKILSDRAHPAQAVSQSIAKITLVIAGHLALINDEGSRS
jgi:hypothetical protein